MQEQTAEYDQYTAVQRIYSDSGALAFDVGHPVPANAIKLHPELLDDGYVELTDQGRKRQARSKAAETRAAGKDSGTDSGAGETKKA